MKTELKNDVLINRKILGWEWYKDITTYKLFTHLIYKANYVDDIHRGVPVLRGQVYTGLDKLSFETGLSLQNIKTSLKKLILTSNITSKSTNKYRIITVLKYNDYQLANKLDNKQSNLQLTSNLTASKEYKELLKELKEVKKELDTIKKSKPKKDVVVYFDDSKLNDLFNNFLIQRKSSKVKNTKLSIQLLLDKLKPFSDDIKIQMINNSILGGWTSVFELKNNNNGTRVKGKVGTRYIDDEVVY